MAVGSKNPVKLDSSNLALIELFAEQQCEVEGFNVPSEVRDQPYGDEETVLGAKNRARHAFEAFTADRGFAPRYAVGLEGGARELADGLECFAWCAVYDGNKFGTARSAAFDLPPSITALMATGVELGVAVDKIFGSSNCKQGQGAIGMLTRGIISRTQYYVPVVTLAFVRFMWPEMYP